MNGKFSGNGFQEQIPPSPRYAQFGGRVNAPNTTPDYGLPNTPIPQYEEGTIVPQEPGNQSAPITHGPNTNVFPQYPPALIHAFIQWLQHDIGMRNRHHEEHTVFVPLLYNLTPASAGQILPQQGSAPDFGNFHAQSLLVDNPSGFTLFIQEVNRYIPPGVFGYLVPCYPAVQRLTLSVFSGSQTSNVTVVIIPLELPIRTASQIGYGTAGGALGTQLVVPPSGTGTTVTGGANATATLTLPAAANQRNHLRGVDVTFNIATVNACTLTIQDGATTVYTTTIPTGALRFTTPYIENQWVNTLVNTAFTITVTAAGAGVGATINADNWVG